jgi:SAM-dependent MidA family methyltransferase
VKSLREKIVQEIHTDGPIAFSRYMEMCLYDPELGYYSGNAEQFGKAGDFYTSSDVHAVFGRLMARQFEEMWRILGSPEQITIRELGPGRGLFAQDVLDWSEKKFPEFFRALHYELIEQSPALRQRIRSTLKSHLESGNAELSVGAIQPRMEASAGSSENGQTLAAGETGRSTSSTRAEAKARLQGASGPEAGSSLTSESGSTIVFANEFFDALPVEVVGTKGSLRIDLHDERFVEIWAPASPQELEFLDRYSVHPEEGERIEVPLQSLAAMRGASDFDRGFLIIIDYGYTRAEQLAGRHRGTLKAIRQHAVSASPYEAPGQQDITADVNFTALAAAAEECGLHSEKLVTQSQFLMGIGEANQFSDAFENCRLPQERAKVALQLKHLVTPAGMGESFHVLVASKGVEAIRLAGLNFGCNKRT